MKITSLISSKSVSEFLEQQNYEFSVLQSAYIIAKCKKLCVREKQAKWKKLSETTSDYEIFNGYTQEHHASLFAVLKQITELQNKYIEQFFQEDEAIFRLENVMRNSESLYVGGNCTHTLYESTHPSEIDNRQGAVFTVNKQLFNNELQITATLNELDEVLDLQVIGAPMNDDNLLSFFRGIELNFPVPFKTGDILFDAENKDVPMVLKGFSNCGRQQACCAIASIDGEISESWVDDVLSLDYYRKPLTEKETTLKAISEQLQASQKTQE